MKRHKSQRPALPALHGALAFLSLSAAATAAGAAATATAGPEDDVDRKVIQLPIRTDGPKSLDPGLGSTVYDNMVCCQVYETLLEPKYSNTSEFEPRLAAKLPERLDDGLRWRFHIKPGVRFQDDPCFPGGKGRELTTDDFFYSWKRLADKTATDTKNFWLLENTIVGFDEYKTAQNAAAKFDYDAPVEGFVKIDDHTFDIKLKEPVYTFLWRLTNFQTSAVPREAVDRYGLDFSSHPVGTGPFVLESWVPKKSVIFNRNPNYHGATYPSDWDEEAREAGLADAAGAAVPFADRLEFTMFVQDQPMWLKFNANKLAYSEVPAEYFEEAFNKRTWKLRRSYKKKGVQGFADPLLDFIFIGFNMEDEVLGGYTEKKKKLRQALSLALDWDERNETFYNSKNIIYDGMIPPGLEGHPNNEEHRAEAAYRGPDVERARRLLSEAGYPGGQGLPPIRYYSGRSGNLAEQAELFQRQLKQIGVKLDVQLVDFSTLIEFINKKKAPLFSFAWSSDYPDGENNLALFYGPNEAPGSNHYNYKRPEYDEMYERCRVMEPGPERTKLYETMRDMVLEDVPYLGSMARVRHYLTNPWIKNCRPTERYWGWFKYLDVDADKR